MFSLVTDTPPSYLLVASQVHWMWFLALHCFYHSFMTSKGRHGWDIYCTSTPEKNNRRLLVKTYSRIVYLL